MYEQKWAEIISECFSTHQEIRQLTQDTSGCLALLGTVIRNGTRTNLIIASSCYNTSSLHFSSFRLTSEPRQGSSRQFPQCSGMCWAAEAARWTQGSRPHPLSLWSLSWNCHLSLDSNYHPDIPKVTGSVPSYGHYLMTVESFDRFKVRPKCRKHSPFRPE